MKNYFFASLCLIIAMNSLAQKNQIQITYLPGLSNTLESSYSLESLPSRNYEFSPVLTHSFSAKYLRRLKNENQLSIGLGILSTAYQVAYSMNPPDFFSGRTDELSATYVSIPIEYVLGSKNLEFSLGLSANFLLDENRTIGIGETDFFDIEPDFDGVALGAGLGVNYIIRLTEILGIVVGVRGDYLVPINQINASANFGISFAFN